MEIEHNLNTQEKELFSKFSEIYYVMHSYLKKTMSQNELNSFLLQNTKKYMSCIKQSLRQTPNESLTCLLNTFKLFQIFYIEKKNPKTYQFSQWVSSQKGEIDSSRLKTECIRLQSEELPFESSAIFWEFLFEFLYRGDIPNLCAMLQNTHYHKNNHAIQDLVRNILKNNFFYNREPNQDKKIKFQKEYSQFQNSIFHYKELVPQEENNLQLQLLLDVLLGNEEQIISLSKKDWKVALNLYFIYIKPVYDPQHLQNFIKKLDNFDISPQDQVLLDLMAQKNFISQINPFFQWHFIDQLHIRNKLVFFTQEKTSYLKINLIQLIDQCKSFGLSLIDILPYIQYFLNLSKNTKEEREKVNKLITDKFDCRNEKQFKMILQVLSHSSNNNELKSQLYQMRLDAQFNDKNYLKSIEILNELNDQIKIKNFLQNIVNKIKQNELFSFDFLNSFQHLNKENQEMIQILLNFEHIRKNFTNEQLQNIEELEIYKERLIDLVSQQSKIKGIFLKLDLQNYMFKYSLSVLQSQKLQFTQKDILCFMNFIQEYENYHHLNQEGSNIDQDMIKKMQNIIFQQAKYVK